MNATMTMSLILAAMAVIAAAEAAIPLHARNARHGAHVAPNLALTSVTLATSLVLNSALILFLDGLRARGLGLLPRLALPAAVETAVVVVVLDFSFYVAHVAMHKVPSLWRWHRVHHCDPVVDVTTTLRQHPGEGVIRAAFLAAFGGALGAGPGAFAAYRAWSALNGLLEHANVRAPSGVDRALALVTTWPHMHKVHHSRRIEETDTNYGNILSWFDRLFGTYTPSSRGTSVVCGLDGLDDAATQTARGLLALPLRDDAFDTDAAPRSAAARAAAHDTSTPNSSRPRPAH